MILCLSLLLGGNFLLLLLWAAQSEDKSRACERAVLRQPRGHGASSSITPHLEPPQALDPVMWDRTVLAVEIRTSLSPVIAATGKQTPFPGALIHFHVLSQKAFIECLLRTRPWDFPGGTVDKDLPAHAGDMGLIPGPGRFHMPRSN